jgi:hypothetical protein
MQSLSNKIAEAKNNANRTPPTSPMASEPPTLLTKTVADYVKDKNKGKVAGISVELSKIDPSAVMGDFARPSSFAGIEQRAKEQTAKERGLGETGAKMIELDKEDIPAAVKLDNIADHIMRQAEKANLKTGTQVEASFQELLKGANKNDLDFLYKYQTSPQIKGTIDMKKLPSVMGKYYERMMNERNSAQTPPVKLSVKNK